MKCCICKKEFEGFGNNPWGAAWLDAEGKVKYFEFETDNDRCCDECNTKYVNPGRLYQWKRSQNDNEV